MRPNYIYGIVCSLILIFIVSCKKLEINNILAGITPVSINFVRSDSTVVSINDCINPADKFMIAIEIKVDPSAANVPHLVHYTYNDSAYKVEFLSSGKKYLPVTFKPGINKIQLDATTLKDSVKLVLQEFELVN